MGTEGKRQYGVAGLFHQFDDAVNRNDRSKMIEILRIVEIDAEGARRIADNVLANRKYYGFPE